MFQLRYLCIINIEKEHKKMRKTKIVCTIGPASESEEVLRELCLNGMNVARLNFSHGTHDEHDQKSQKRAWSSDCHHA